MDVYTRGPKLKWVFTFIFGFGIISTAVARRHGCYVDRRQDRPEYVAPGYNAPLTGASDCQEACNFGIYTTALIFGGTVCLCASSKDQMTLIRDTGECTEVGEFDVYEKGDKVVVSDFGMAATSPTGVVSVGEAVTFKLNVTAHPLESTAREMVFYDSFVRWRPMTNTESTVEEKYVVPGTHTALARLVKADGRREIISTGYQVHVTQPIIEQDVNFTCYPRYVTHSEHFQCILNMSKGVDLEAEIDWKDGQTETVTLHGLRPERAGRPIISSDIDLGPSVSDPIVMVSSFFKYRGNLRGFEFYASGSGNINLLLLRRCTGASQYHCLKNDECSADATCMLSVTCSSSNQPFNPLSHACVASGANAWRTRMNKLTRGPSTNANTYTVVQMKEVTSQVGYNFVLITDNWEVMPGDTIGFHSGGGVIIATRNITDYEGVDFSTSGSAPSIGSTLGSTWTPQAVQHQFSAVSLPTNINYFYHEYMEPGSMDIKIKVKNTYFPDNVFEKTVTSNIETGINASILIMPSVGAVNETITFTFAPHTGTQVNYSINFADGRVHNATVSGLPMTHTYTGIGTFLLEHTIWNEFSSKRNFTTFVVMERITIPNMVVPPGVVGEELSIIVNMTQGSNYTCHWQIGTLRSFRTTQADQLTYTFSPDTPETYPVTVNCTNELNSVKKTGSLVINERIEGLQLEKAFFKKDETFKVKAIVSAGNNLNFNFSYKGVPKTMTANDSCKCGLTDEEFTESGLGANRAFLFVYNAISNATLYLNITINTEIKEVNLNFPTYMTKGEPAVLDLSMAQGSGATVSISWGDNTQMNRSNGPGVEWSEALRTNHSYTVGGRYNFTIIIDNGVSTYVFSKIITILAPLANYTLTPVKLFSDVGVPAQFQMLRNENGSDAAVDANITFKWNNGSEQEMLPFEEFRLFNHTYNTLGVYGVEATLKNPLPGPRTGYAAITIMNAVDGFTCEFQPRFGIPGTTVNTTVTMTRGEDVNTTFTHGDGSDAISMQKPNVAPNTVYKFSNTYPTVGTYNITAEACNPVGCKVCMNPTYIQHPVDNNLKISIIDNVKLPENDTLKIVLEWKGDADKFPTNTNFTIRLSNGTVLKVGRFNTSVNPLQIPITFTKGDAYPVDILVGNQMSSKTLSTKLKVFETFRNFSIQILYIDRKTGEIKPGFGDRGNQYPTNTPVLFQTYASSGWAEYLELTYSKNRGPIQTDRNFSLMDNSTAQKIFTEVGDYMLIFRAINRFFVIRRVLNITVGGSLRGLRILSRETFWTPNVAGAVRIQWEALATDSCLCVTFDGTEKYYFSPIEKTCLRCPYYERRGPIPSMENFIEFPRTYMTEGDYNATVYAYNGKINDTKSLAIPVSDQQCASPVLEMRLPAHTVSTNPLVGYKSKRVEVTGVIRTLRCSVYQNTKDWAISKLDPTTGGITDNINVSSLSRDTTVLTIPPNFLHYGKYKLEFSATLNKTLTVITYRTAIHSYLRIDPSPLHVYATPSRMNTMARGREDRICLNPGNSSYDPDIPDRTADQGFTSFHWYCWKEGETLPTENIRRVMPYPKTASFTPNRPGCFGDGPGQLNTAAGSFCFEAMNMEVNNTYYMKIVGNKGTRSAETRIRMIIVEGRPPFVQVQCRSESMCQRQDKGDWKGLEFIVNPSETLPLHATCTGNCDERTYRWGFYLLNVTSSRWQIVQFRNSVARNEPDLVALDSTVAMTVAIDPLLYHYFPKVTRFRGCFFVGNRPNVGYSCLQFSVNRVPSIGNCTVDKHVVAATESLCIKCRDFTDDDNITQYIFSSYYESERYVMGYNSTGDFCHQMPYREKPQQLCVDVLDSRKALVKYCYANISVIEKNASTIEEIFFKFVDSGGSVSEVDQILNSGDIQQAASVIMGLSTFMNEMSDRAIKAANGNLSNAEYKRLQEKRTELLTKLTDFAVNNMHPSDEASLMLTNSVLKAISNNKNDLSRFDQKRIMDKAKQTSKVLENLKGELSRETIAAIAQPAIDTVLNIMETATHQLNRATATDEKTDQTAMDYNTDLESTDSRYSGPMEVARGDLLKATSTQRQGMLQAHLASLGFGGVFKSLRDTMLDAIVPNGKPLTFEAGKGNLTFAKFLNTEQISGANYLSDSTNVTIPNLCKTLIALGRGCNESVGLMMLISKFNPMNGLPSSNPKGPKLQDGEGIITIEMTSSNGSRIKVDLVDPFEFQIKNNDPKPEFLNGRTEIPPPQVLPGSQDIGKEPTILYQRLIMYKTSFNGTEQSIHFEMRFDVCTQFLVVVKFFKPPSLMDKLRGYDYYGMIPSHTKYCDIQPGSISPDPYTYFIDNTQFKTAKQKSLANVPDWYNIQRDVVYIGIRELHKHEYNSYTSTNAPAIPYEEKNFLTVDYTYRIYSRSCNRIDEEQPHKWTQQGCKVGANSNATNTQCTCNTLTTFAGGWIVPPNSIDFDYVFANFDFYKNPTLYATEIGILVIYILVMIWARYADQRDLEKLGVTPLADNDPSDVYLYEIVIQTGLRKGAGCDSRIFFVLSGERDETDIRYLFDNKRKVFRRGETNRFLLAVPKSLGPLQYVRLWHDNSGKGSMASWYCNYFGVVDLQTRTRYHFIINSWFGVEHGDGQIDRLFPVSPPSEMRRFFRLLAQQTAKGITDGHLFISVVARPPESRFTRRERVTVCYFLLYLTMLATCMYYRKSETEKDKRGTGIEIGPFKLSPTELYIGCVTNLITFFPILLVIELFRKSELYFGHSNQLKKAIEYHRTSKKRRNKVFPSTPDTAGSRTELMSEDSDRTAESPRSLNQVDVDLSTQKNPKKDEAAIKIKQKFLLPWWVRIFTWIFMALGILVSAVFVTFYGIVFGNESCKQWLSSMFLSFFTSLLLTQPLKVVLLAIVLSLIFRRPRKNLKEEDIMDRDNEVLNELGIPQQLDEDEEWTHEDELEAPTKPKRIQLLPPKTEELDKAREERIKELKMYEIMREITLYVVFFMLLLMVTYNFRDPNSFFEKEQMQSLFVAPGHPTADFEGIRNEEDFWAWAFETLVPALRAGVWYNGYPPLFLRGFTGDRAGRMMGFATMRQLRIKRDVCSVARVFKHIDKNCSAAYTMADEDTANYAPGWKPLPRNHSADNSDNPMKWQKGYENNSDHAYIYRTWKQLDSYPYLGRHALYTGSGYVHSFRGGPRKLKRDLKHLQASRWIDRLTRAVFVEFTIFNPNINLFCVATMLLEFPGGGGIWSTYRFEAANLLSFLASENKAFEIFCMVGFVIFLLVFIVRECHKLHDSGCRKYIVNFWNISQLFVIVASIASMATYGYMIWSTIQLTEKFHRYHGDAYVKFQFVAYWHEHLAYATAFIVFATTLQFIRLLRFNKRMGMLGAVLTYSSKDIGQFFIIFGIIFLAFVQVFYLLFMDTLYRYHSFLHSLEASMQIALGKFEFLELYEKQPYLGPIVFVAFVIFIIFVMLNMFLAILNEAFTMVRQDIDKRQNEFELIDFILQRFLHWSGINKTAFGKRLFSKTLSPSSYIENSKQEVHDKIGRLPEKVNALIERANKLLEQGRAVVNESRSDKRQKDYKPAEPVTEL